MNEGGVAAAPRDRRGGRRGRIIMTWNRSELENKPRKQEAVGGLDAPSIRSPVPDRECRIMDACVAKKKNVWGNAWMVSWVDGDRDGWDK